MKKLLLLLFPFIIFSSLSKEYNDKDELFRDLKEKFSGLKSIIIIFKSEGATPYSGKVEAKKGDKFKLVVPDRVITSNGKSLWNYSINEKKVLLSSIEKKLETLSINSIFFTYLNNSKPESLKKITSSNKTKQYLLVLIPIDEKTAKNFKSIKVWLSSAIDISKIEMKNESTTQTLIIKQMKLNPKLEDKYFEFKTPKNVEVIDLR